MAMDLRKIFRRLGREDCAAQMAEFAIALPLLMIFVVGIFDFSTAYTLKQKLTNIARDAARVAAADPASDLTNNVPASIVDAYEVIDNYLLANQINPCGMSLPTASSSALVWTITANSNGCPPGGITIVINRGYYFADGPGNQPAAVGCAQTGSAGVQTSLISTCVSIQYAYQWQFGRVATLVGGNTFLPTSIAAVAVSLNEN